MVEALAKPRLGRAEWIREGLMALAQVGVEAVRVEPLAKRLGVTKGSFYHHFKDRDDLLVALLDSWRERATSLVILLVNQYSDRSVERIRRLLELVVDSVTQESFGLLDVGIRDWARRDRRAQSVVEAVDALRLEYIADRFIALGCTREDAEFRAFFVYSYILGEGQMGAASSNEQRRARVDFCIERMTHDLEDLEIREAQTS